MSETTISERVDPLLGKSIAGYQFSGKLGQGAFGAVYLARHPRLDRNVAVKYIELQQKEEFEDVEREVHILERLQHNHIVRIDDTFRFENYQLIMMELVEGGSLRGMLGQLNGDLLDTPTIVTMVDQVAQALDYVHDQQILHLDLKPENILIDPQAEGKLPRFVLTDFGIARFTRPDGQLSNLAGTPRYMSPEQFEFEHGRIDHRVDIYALGIILYELIVGHAPFRARMLYELARQHLHELPVPPSLLVPSLSPQIESVILTALAKKPEDRFASAGALSQALKATNHVADERANLIDGMTLKVMAQHNANSLDLISQRSHPTDRARDSQPVETEVIRLAVMGPDGVEKLERFQKTFVMVGRQPDLDLVLNDTQVSRRHARIDADVDGQWYVSDLGSRHGTFLDGERLTPDQRYPWRAGQYLSIRGFLLRRMDEPAASRDSGWVIVDSETAPTDAAGEDLSPSQLIGLLDKAQEEHRQPHVGFVVSPDVIHVRPGRPYYIKAHAKPENAPTTTYRLKVTHGPGGINESWYTLPAPKTITSGETQSFDMTITAPMVESGDYEMFIGIVADDPRIPDAAQIVKVKVEPTLQYNISLKPNVFTHRMLPLGHGVTLNLQNNSNYAETFFIDVKTHDRLKVKLQHRELLLVDGSSRDVKLWIKPRRGAREQGRLWFTVTVRPKSSDGQKEETGSYAFSSGTQPRPSLFSLVLIVAVLAVFSFVGFRLASGASIDLIWSEIVNFLAVLRHEIEMFIQRVDP